jgi:hypothetical protein
VSYAHDRRRKERRRDPEGYKVIAHHSRLRRGSMIASTRIRRLATFVGWPSELGRAS